MQDRSRRCRLELLETVSSAYWSCSLCSPHMCLLIQDPWRRHAKTHLDPSQEFLAAGVYLRRMEWFSKSVGGDCQRRCCLSLQLRCRLCCRSVHVRDPMLYSTRSLSRDSRGYWAAEIIAWRFRSLSSTVEKLKWSCVIARYPHALNVRSRETCSIQTCRTSSVWRDLVGDEPAGGPQLQWATQTEFRPSMKPHEVNCCAIPLPAAGGGGVIAVLAKAVAGLDLETQAGEVIVLFADGSSGFGHPSDSCPRQYLSRTFPTSRTSWMVSPKFWRVYPVLTRWTAAHTTRWSDLRHGMTGTAESEEAVCCPIPDLWRKSTQVQVSQRRRHGVRRRQQSVCHREGLRSHLPSVNVSCGSFWWQTVRSRSQWSYSHTDSWPVVVRALRSALLGAGAAASVFWSSQIAWPSKRRFASSSRPRTCRSTCKAGSSSGQVQKLALSLEEEFEVGPGAALLQMEFTEVLNGSGSGGRGILRLSGRPQVQRILCTRHEYPGVIMAAHQTRVREDLATLTGESWSCFHQCGHFRTLRRATVMISGAFDECRVAGFDW